MPRCDPRPAASARRSLPRRGVSAVEFAVVLPFLGLLVAGVAEFGRAITVRQVLHDAVRKAARTGALPNRTSAQITQEVNDVLTGNGLSPSAAVVTIRVNGNAVDAATAVKNDQVSVTAAVPFSKVSWIPALFLTNSATVSSTLVMQRQG